MPDFSVDKVKTANQNSNKCTGTCCSIPSEQLSRLYGQSTNRLSNTLMVGRSPVLNRTFDVIESKALKNSKAVKTALRILYNSDSRWITTHDKLTQPS